MSRRSIEKSIRLWTEREVRARSNWRRYVRRKSKSPRRAFWYGKYRAAQVRVRYRRRQLRRYLPKGVSDKGLSFIQKYEGFRARPYRDTHGKWAIGYGDTRGIGPNTRPITRKKAARKLKRRLDRDFFPAIRLLPTFEQLSQDQVDALLSFTYNVGPGALSDQTRVGRALRRGALRKAADGLLDWDKSEGKVLAGLSKRRRAERSLFLRA